MSCMKQAWGMEQVEKGVNSSRYRHGRSSSPATVEELAWHDSKGAPA